MKEHNFDYVPEWHFAIANQLLVVSLLRFKLKFPTFRSIYLNGFYRDLNLFELGL